jgi:hypothetical protein
VLQIAAGTEGGLLSELEHARLLASLAVIMARREFKGEADRLAAEVGVGWHLQAHDMLMNTSIQHQCRISISMVRAMNSSAQ